MAEISTAVKAGDALTKHIESMQAKYENNLESTNKVFLGSFVSSFP